VLYITRSWARIDPVSAGLIPAAIPIDNIDGVGVTFSSAPLDQGMTFGAQIATTRAPRGATHQLLTFDGGQLDAGAAFNVLGFNFDRIG
jgi:hypothetical protein